MTGNDPYVRDLREHLRAALRLASDLKLRPVVYSLEQADWELMQLAPPAHLSPEAREAMRGGGPYGSPAPRADRGERRG